MKLYEVYTDVQCPRCGCTDARDAGPYEPDWTDEALGPPDDRVHLMWCSGCGKPFDWACDGAEEIKAAQRAWNEAYHKRESAIRGPA